MPSVVKIQNQYVESQIQNKISPLEAMMMGDGKNQGMVKFVQTEMASGMGDARKLYELLTSPRSENPGDLLENRFNLLETAMNLISGGRNEHGS